MCVCVPVFTCAWACKRTPARVCVCVSTVVEEMRRQATQNTPLFTDAAVTTATYMKTRTHEWALSEHGKSLLSNQNIIV